MKLIRTEDAVGCVLCHDLTQIIKGVTKDAVFRKGHVVRPEDIPVLLSIGKDNLYVWEADESMLHENDAARILCDLCKNEGMLESEVKEGKITFTELKKATEYKFEVFAKIDDNFVDLMTVSKFSTSKIKPTTASVTMSLYEKNGQEQILIRFKVDNTEAIKTIVFDSNKRHMTISQNLFAEKSIEFYESLKDGVIEINYNVNDLICDEQLILDEYEIKFDLLFIYDEFLFRTDSMIDDLFE
jgi:hypothetical protein